MDCAMQMHFNGIYVSFERNFSKFEELINQTKPMLRVNNKVAYKDAIFVHGILMFCRIIFLNKPCGKTYRSYWIIESTARWMYWKQTPQKSTTVLQTALIRFMRVSKYYAKFIILYVKIFRSFVLTKPSINKGGKVNASSQVKSSRTKCFSWICWFTQSNAVILSRISRTNFPSPWTLQKSR